MPNSISMKAIDVGQNFLTGQVTSVFAANGVEVAGTNLYELTSNIQNKAADMMSDLQNTAITTMSTVTGGVGSALGSVVGTGLALSSNVMQMHDIAQEAIMDCTSYAANLVTKKITELTSGIPGQLTKQVAYWSGEELKKAMESIPKKFLEDTDDATEKQQDEQKKKGLSGIIGFVNTYTGKVKDTVKDFTTKLNSSCDEIGTWALQGPRWVTGQVDMLEEQFQNVAYEFVDEQANNIKKFRDQSIENIAKSVAKQVVAKQIAALEKNIDKLTNTTNKTKAKTIAKAKTAIQKAKFKLAGKLGVSPA